VRDRGSERGVTLARQHCINESRSAFRSG
jgi:hypothetical protein